MKELKESTVQVSFGKTLIIKADSCDCIEDSKDTCFFVGTYPKSK